MPKWIKKAKDIGLVWEDMNKYQTKKDVAGSGGLVVLIAFMLGVLTYIFIQTFIFNGSNHTVEIFALLTMVLFIGLIGLIDDLFGWAHGGLSRRVRIALTVLASIPLVVINAGSSNVVLPFFGSVTLEYLYPLLIIPLAIGFVTTTYNFLAGFNGLEAGMGILILSYFSFVSYVTGYAWLAIIGLCMVTSLAAFIIFNWSPARVFPGDVLTYSVGALIAGMAILGNFEKIAIIVYIPYLIEVILKSRGKLVVHSFGNPQKNGGLTLKQKKLYGLTHVSIWFLSFFKKKVTEKDCVYFIYSIEIVFILLATVFLFS